jgi:hypothetical protein
MSGESLLALAVCHAPQFDGFVIRPSDELLRVRRVEQEAGDGTAAIVSQMSASRTALRLCPAEGGRGRRHNRY